MTYFMKDKDPRNPTDMLGQPIEEGDYVAYPVSAGRAIGMAVGRIVKVGFRKKNPNSSDWRRQTIACSRAEADRYNLRIQPLQAAYKSHYSEDTEYVEAGFVDKDGQLRHFRPTGRGVKPVTLQKVNNAVKLNMDHIEDYYRQRAEEARDND